MVAYTYCSLGRIKQARQKLLQISADYPDERYKTSMAALSQKIQDTESQQVMGRDADTTG
jgi:hypothetical protein